MYVDTRISINKHITIQNVGIGTDQIKISYFKFSGNANKNIRM